MTLAYTRRSQELHEYLRHLDDEGISYLCALKNDDDEFFPVVQHSNAHVVLQISPDRKVFLDTTNSSFPFIVQAST